MINIIDTLKQSGAASFPIVEALDIKGGYHAVATIAARDAITAAFKEDGMLVGVTSTSMIYRWFTNKWVPFMPMEGIQRLTDGQDGSIVVKDANGLLKVATDKLAGLGGTASGSNSVSLGPNNEAAGSGAIIVGGTGNKIPAGTGNTVLLGTNNVTNPEADTTYVNRIHVGPVGVQNVPADGITASLDGNDNWLPTAGAVRRFVADVVTQNAKDVLSSTIPFKTTLTQTPTVLFTIVKSTPYTSQFISMEYHVATSTGSHISEHVDIVAEVGTDPLLSHYGELIVGDKPDVTFTVTTTAAETVVKASVATGTAAIAGFRCTPEHQEAVSTSVQGSFEKAMTETTQTLFTLNKGGAYVHVVLEYHLTDNKGNHRSEKAVLRYTKDQTLSVLTYGGFVVGDPPAVTFLIITDTAPSTKVLASAATGYTIRGTRHLVSYELTSK